MDSNEKSNSDYLAMAELSNEIGSIVQKSIEEGHKELTPLDIEHILKLTTDVVFKIKSKSTELEYESVL